jgi:hypothetical protein
VQPKNGSHRWIHPLLILTVAISAYFVEFLTEETTCATVMSKRTTSQNFCQKRPPAASTNAGTPPAASTEPGTPPAAVPKAGTWASKRRRTTPSPRVGPAAKVVAGMSTWTMPPHPSPAPWRACTDSPAKAAKASSTHFYAKEKELIFMPGREIRLLLCNRY